MKPLLNAGLLILLVAGGLYLVLALWLYFAQSKLVFLPSRSLVATPEALNLRFTDLRLQTSDSVAIHAWFVPAENSRGAVLFCHGNAGNISNRLSLIEVYHRLGLDVLIFDYRGYGQSEGTPSEEGTYRDARAAWDYLVGERDIPPEKIILLGRSLGGAVAAQLAAQLSESVEARPAGLILESVFTSIPEMGAKLYPYMPVRTLSRIYYDNLSYVPLITCPLLVIHSPDDEVAPFEFGRRVYEAANQPKRFLQISGSHDDGYDVSSTVYQNGVNIFASDVLSPANERDQNNARD